MGQCDFRHLRQILIDDLGQFFGFEPVGGLGKADNVGKEHCQLFARAGDLDLLLATEDRIVDLRREILRQLAGQLLQIALARVDQRHVFHQRARDLADLVFDRVGLAALAAVGEGAQGVTHAVEPLEHAPLQDQPDEEVAGGERDYHDDDRYQRKPGDVVHQPDLFFKIGAGARELVVGGAEQPVGNQRVFLDQRLDFELV